jgi:S1-C subfamily serine protease
MRVFAVLLAGLAAASMPCAATAQAAPKKQLAAKKAAASKPNPAIAAYAAMPIADKIAIQTDLIWTGDYNGVANGDFSERAIGAVKAFQVRNGGKDTGILTPQERAALAAAAKAKQETAGWRVLDDSVTGARVGIPLKIVARTGALKEGTRWASAHGEVVIETFRVAEPGTTLAMVLDRQKKAPASRAIGYNVLRPDFFVVSGTQGLRRFYVRGQVNAQGDEIRGVTILYDQAIEGIMSPLVIAMSNAFQPFPSGSLAGPLPKRKVDYGTGIVVNATGYVVTDRQVTEGCYVVTLPGLGGADVVAEDKTADLALLRVYGVPSLGPLATAEAKAGDVTLAGIPDPQAQGGGDEIVLAKARLSETLGLDPAPRLGYSGAPALNAQGQLIGIVQLKPGVVAGPGPAGAQAQLVPVATMKAFLEANKVEMPASTQTIVGSAKRSVVRVICARR